MQLDPKLLLALVSSVAEGIPAAVTVGSASDAMSALRHSTAVLAVTSDARTLWQAATDQDIVYLPDLDPVAAKKMSAVGVLWGLAPTIAVRFAD